MLENRKLSCRNWSRRDRKEEANNLTEITRRGKKKIKFGIQYKIIRREIEYKKTNA